MSKLSHASQVLKAYTCQAIKLPVLYTPVHVCMYSRNVALSFTSHEAAAHIDDDIIEELLRKYQSKFISVVDAHAIVDELCEEKIIDEDLAERVRKETTKDAASSMIYQHLVRQADGGHLDRVCTLMMAKESFPRMRKWAEKMRSELRTCEWSLEVCCVCVCVCMCVCVHACVHVNGCMCVLQ